MNKIRLGIVLETAELPVRQALARAADYGQFGLRGLQANALAELAPDQLTQTGRRELRTLLKSYDLELVALHCPLRRGLDNPDQLQLRLDHLKKVLQLACDLGPRLVTMPLPKLPGDPLSPAALTLRESLQFLGKAGDHYGVRIALEGGLDSGASVRDYLKQYDVGSLWSCYDPANYYLNGFQPIDNLLALGNHVQIVQARDARSASVSRTSEEVPVGAGNIDWMLFFATLESLDYRGFVLVDREQGSSRFQDAINGVKFLARFAPPSES